MKKELRVFNSHQEAEDFEYQELRKLTFQDKMRIFLEMMEPYYAAAPRLQRIYRTAELSQCPIRDDWRLGVQLTRPTEDDR